MTKNQIEYLKYKESQRSNLANEKLKGSELAETSRHNVAYETETERHNKAVESISLEELGIKQQQADASEMQAYAAAKNAETNRLNYAENARSNRVYESIGMLQARNASVQANASMTQALAAQANASTQKYNAATSRMATQSNIKLNEAKVYESESNAKYKDTQTKYAGQRNAREWIDTATGGVSTILKGVMSVIPFV